MQNCLAKGAPGSSLVAGNRQGRALGADPAKSGQFFAMAVNLC